MEIMEIMCRIHQYHTIIKKALNQYQIMEGFQLDSEKFIAIRRRNANHSKPHLQDLKK